MTVGLRYRLVTLQGTLRDGDEHVSSVVLSEDEALESLDMEAHIHEAGGWTVTRYQTDDGYLVGVRARSPRGVRRYIFARSFTPHNDTPEGSDQ